MSFVKCVDIFAEEIHRARLRLLSTPLSCLHFTTGSWHSFGRFIFESLSTAILLVFYNSIFVIYYHLLAGFGLWFTLRILCTLAILLTRMKIFNSFVRKHFTSKPQLIASSLFLTCLFIDSPVAFALKISSYHYYTDNKQENVNIFYIMTASDFSSTPYGQLLLAFTSFFLNLLLTLVVGVILNIVSVCQYKLYLREEKKP